MKKRIIIILIALVFVGASFGAGFLMKSEKSSAAVPALLPFGGHLAVVDFCECSGTFDLFYLPITPAGFLPPSGAWLGYTGLTWVYSYYNMLTPGVWHMGRYIPGMQSCWVFHRRLCFPLGDAGMIIEVGTSALPTPF